MKIENAHADKKNQRILNFKNFNVHLLPSCGLSKEIQKVFAESLRQKLE